MNLENTTIKNVAILGAGVMGAQIAAHFANLGYTVLLFDLPSDKKATAISEAAIANLKKLKPAPITLASSLERIVACSYANDLPKLANCQLVVEAVAERLDIKEKLFGTIAPFINSQAILATNTSGLSIQTLAEQVKAINPSLAERFLGIHFFNPPRYMPLVELIPQSYTATSVVDALEIFVVKNLGKRVVRAKDTPNFIANRIGTFSLLSTIYYAEKFGLGLDEVDALTGTQIGRAKSASFRTLDVVGLDVFGHVAKTMENGLPQDPWLAMFSMPAWYTELVTQGALGQKVGKGIFFKQGKEISVYDTVSKTYVAQTKTISDEVSNILKEKNWGVKLTALRACQNPQAQFLWSIFRELFVYCAYHASQIVTTLADIDWAIRWGFGWKEGPFEIWQKAGWAQISTIIAEDIAANCAFSQTTMPAWVAQITAAHNTQGSFNPAKQIYQSFSSLSIYKEFLGVSMLDGQETIMPTTKSVVYENAGIRIIEIENSIGILSFKSKMNSAGAEVLQGLLEGIPAAEKVLKGLVIWQNNPAVFCAGANLQQVVEGIHKESWAELETMVANFQLASLSVKHSSIPVVAAVEGLALGGGCEFVMHASRVVASEETYMGLVEVGVGLLPAGAGCKEWLIRLNETCRTPAELKAKMQKVFEYIAMGKVTSSASEAKDWGYLRQSDIIVPSTTSLLQTAIREVHAMISKSYVPISPSLALPVLGDSFVGFLKAMLANMLVGGFISQHDSKIGGYIAEILTGGGLDRNTTASQDVFLHLERKYFYSLLREPKTQERIAYMLAKGKALRN
jgi:3-hydroxyacyl-CoA dehydrogenase